MTKAEQRIIKNALYDAMKIEIKAIEALPEVKVEYTDSYTATLKKIKKDYARQHLEQKRLKKQRRVILVAAILTALALAATACAVIEPIRNFIIEITTEGTTFKPDPDIDYETNGGSNKDNNTNNNSDEELGITYIPEGFLLDEGSILNISAVYDVFYYKGDKYINYSRSLISSSASGFDSEGTPTQILNIDGKEVYLFTKWKTDQAVWHDEVYRYVIAYPEELDFSEVEKMIKSAK